VGPALILLLDTAVLLWATSEPGRLTGAARVALEDARNDIWVSVASAWEIATKHRLGRLPQGAPFVRNWDAELGSMGYEQLPITPRHALRGSGYEAAHGDPFDRIIAAQADVEQMVVVASDRAFDLFPVRRLW
jgi:PIN domain nuclease of toxin-antitoxin system